MRFDDRLFTVLNLPPGDRHDRAVRWRQLVDLVARAGSNSASPAVAQALETIRAEGPNVEESLRAAAARAVAALPLPLALLKYFASDKLAVSAPVLAAATLEPAQWRALAEAADAETRRFIETLHPDSAGADIGFTETLVEPAPAAAPAPPPAPQAESAASPPAEPPAGGTSLSEVVARIERRRRKRSAGGAVGGAPANGGDAPGLFRWECGPSGEIAWVEGAPRGSLVGRSIARAGESATGGVDREVARAFAMRAPFRDAALHLAGEGLVGGDWKISGVPAFEPSDGRFAGYRGIALRETPAPQPLLAPSELLADPASLRELVHEIKTPLNAIIGFAEIIDGQYLGPADHRYRRRAGQIVAQARLLLAAIDDLDFAAKVHSGRPGGAPRVDLAELLDHGGASLRALAAEHGAELDIDRGGQRSCVAAVEPELADRLVARLCAAVAGRSERGERLRLSLDQVGGVSRVAIGRPATLRGLTEAQLFSDARGETEQTAGPPDFALRLIRGLARLAGGDFIVTTAGLALTFPNA